MLKKIFKCLIFLFFFFNLNFWNFMYLLLFYFILYNFLYPNFYFIYFNNMFFIDNVNFWLILLTIWIFFLMVISMFNFKINNNNNLLFIFFLILLFFFLYFSFSVNNMLFFYIFFEMSLIPTLYLILGWGYQPERLMAGLYLLFYTLIASLPLLMGILYLNIKYKMYFLTNLNILYSSSLFLFYSMMMAFLVKMPMFLVHLWLPKAHVEAPISGSMILAAILLKLGGYGLLRMMMMMYFFKNINLLIMLISVYGGILISFNCLRQLDMKLLIAYSSVAHMGLVLGGLFTISIWGINGSFFLMIAHGLCSSGLFCLANISYERLMSRSMLINKGMINFMPYLSIWWFLLIINNMSSPISLNLLSEISLINSMIYYSIFNLFLIFLLCFFSAAYCYYIYSYTQHGIFYSSIFSFTNITIREISLLMFHWLPLNILFMKILII